MDGTNENSITKTKKTAKTGVFRYVFTSYEALSRKWEQSAVYNLLSKASVSKPISRVRRKISRSFEESTILRIFSRFIGMLPGVTLRAYGTFIFSLGLYSSLVFIIRAVASTLTSDIDTLITGIMLAISAIPLLLSKKTLAEAVLESRIGSFVAFDVLGYRREEAALSRTVHKRCDTAMLAGMVLGLCSFYIDVLRIVTALLCGVLIYIIMSRPEAGVVILFAVAPFLPQHILTIYILVLSCSYFCKLITGRRTLRFDAADTVMLIFFISVILAGAVHYGAGTEIGGYSFSPLMFVYFIITNLIKNDKWCERCRHAIMVGGGCAAFVFLISRIFDIEGFLSGGFASSVLTRLSEGVLFFISEVGEATPYLLMVLPITISYAILNIRENGAFLAVISAALTVSAVIYTASRSLWLGAVVGIMILIIAKNIVYVWIPVATLITVPAAIWILPPSIDRYILEILDLSGADTVARVHIRETSLQIFSDNFFGGIGFSDDVFASMYASYSGGGVGVDNTQCLPLGIGVRLGIAGLLIFMLAMLLIFIKSVSSAHNSDTLDEKAVSVSSAAGLFAILFSGMTMDIFSDMKVFLLFFMFTAFISVYSGVKPKPSHYAENTAILRDGKNASVDIDYN